jgi:hypothetical protein
MSEVEKRISEVNCPQCKANFVLKWNDYDDKPATLILRACPSGGVYDVAIECPYCGYHEEL